LERSGRVKCKGPVIEENTFDDAYSIEEDSSGDDFVKTTYVKGKGIELGKRVVNRDDNGKKGTKHDSGAAKKRKKLDIIELGRSGRVKCKGPVIEDNTVDDAYSVEDDSSGDDFVKTTYVKGKDIELGKRVVNRDDNGKKGTKHDSGAAKKRKKSNIIGDDNEKDKKVKQEKGESSSFETAKREYEEIKAGGFGNGELQGPFVEEEGDPMPEDKDGLLWKLNKYVENIRKERNGFVRTFAAADVVFRGNTLIADVYQQYRETLNYKDGISEGKSSSKLSGDNNEEPHKVCAVQIAGDTTSKDYDSSKKQNDFEVPSFSPGVSQDFEMVLSLESPVTDTHTYALGSTHNLEPVEGVSLSMCKPVLKGEDLGNAHGKMKYTKAQVARSSFRSRVTDINVAESNEEKKVEPYLLKKMGIDKSEVLFETKTGTMASTLQMESLVNGEIIDDGVVDAWCEFLNSLECLRSENSMSRFFLPTFVVDKKLFGMEAKANESVTKFLLNVEKVNEGGGRKSIIKQVDLVFIPVSNDGHKFLICFNMKYPAVNLIDSKNILTKDGYIKSMVVTNTNDMVVATVL
nr:hypothetical protein [Tanacetum cinerariifolium]